MLVRRGFRAAVEAVGVADPVNSVDVDAAPLMGILVFVHMLVGDAEDVQAQPGSAGAAGAGRGAQNEIAVRVVIVRRGHGISHPAVEQGADGNRDAVNVFLRGQDRFSV